MKASKNLLFTIVAISIPFLFLGLIEIGLRLVDYDSIHQDAFIEVPNHPEFKIANVEFGVRYFQNFKPQIAPNIFEKEKKENTIRIFVLGGSSTQGFPHNFNNAFPVEIEQQLLKSTLDKRIEVINLGMTAVNSFVVRDLIQEIVPYEPDAVVIYAGHNEYYGSFGVGSSQYGIGNSIALKNFVLKLKRIRLYQLLEQLIFPRTEQPKNRTMMSTVVKKASIKYGEDIYKIGVEQFNKNIAAVLQELNKREIPVVIGTVVSNLKDQAPLGDNEDALEAFEKGNQFYQANNIDSAYYYYELSKELDEIRFRAPNALNETIRQLASQYNAHLVEMEPLAAKNSRSGIPDSSFFDDHLHPNAMGYKVLGQAFYEELAKVETIKKELIDPIFETTTPISKFEEAYADIQIKRLLVGYPFVKGITADQERDTYQRYYENKLRSNFIDSIAAYSWRNKKAQVYTIIDVVNYAIPRNDSLTVVSNYIPLSYWQQFNIPMLKKIVNYSIKSRRFDAENEIILRLAHQSNTNESFFSSSLGALYLINDSMERAKRWLEIAEEINSNDPTVLYNFARYYSMQKDTANAREYYYRYRTVISK